MQEKTDKLITWVLLGIGVLASIFAIFFATSEKDGLFDAAYWITLIFVVVALLGMLGFFCVRFIKNFKENPKQARKTLYVIAVAIVVALLSYILASGTDVPMDLLNKNDLTQATSKWIGAACIAVYILVVGALLSIIYVECAKMFKK